MNPKKYLLIPLLSLLLFACEEVDDSSGLDEGAIGYRPVYGAYQTSEIEVVSPQAVVNPGKIYVYQNYLLVNEINQGIHLFDNQNPEAPTPIGFLRIMGNSDMAIKDDVLYVDHMGNLVALTIADLNAVEEKGRLTLANWNLGLPPPVGHHFECVDQSKGLVVKWQKVSASKMNCYAIR